MRKLIAIFAAVVVGVLIASSHSRASKKEAGLDPLEGAQAIASEAMQHLEKGDLDGMFAALKPHFPLDDKDLDQLQTLLKQQREFVRPALGQPIGEVDFVSHHSLGSSFARYIYLEKWDKSAFVWQLTFYRGRDRWQLNQISWNDKPLDLFQ